MIWLRGTARHLNLPRYDMIEIDVVIELSSEGLYYGTCVGLPGLLVATKTLTDMEFAIPRAIIELHNAKGKNIGVKKSNKFIMKFELTGEGL